MASECCIEAGGGGDVAGLVGDAGELVEVVADAFELVEGGMVERAALLDDHPAPERLPADIFGRAQARRSMALLSILMRSAGVKRGLTPTVSVRRAFHPRIFGPRPCFCLLTYRASKAAALAVIQRRNVGAGPAAQAGSMGVQRESGSLPLVVGSKGRGSPFGRGPAAKRVGRVQGLAPR